MEIRYQIKESVVLTNNVVKNKTDNLRVLLLLSESAPNDLLTLGSRFIVHHKARKYFSNDESTD
jgi:hypothetical protein